MRKTFIPAILALLLGLSACKSSKQAAATAKPVEEKKPENIVLMIGDGMGVAQIFAGLTMNGGWLALEQFLEIGFSKTNSSDNYVTDSAAGATALSIGEKTKNYAIGVDSVYKPKETILETAEKKGKSTGLVVTCDITHATPASFAAHVRDRKMMDDIALQMAFCGAEVMIGGGKMHFNHRKDGINLIDTLTKQGYTVLDSNQSFQNFKGEKLVWFGGVEHLPSIEKGRDTSYLANASLTALNILNQNPNGFFLMIEGSQIDWGGHNNETNYIGTEMIDFDRAIAAVLKWAKADSNTLVIITADHETGGFALNQGSFTKKTVDGKFTTGGHTGVMVPVFAFGPGAEKFKGIYNNNEIYVKMMQLFGF